MPLNVNITKDRESVPNLIIVSISQRKKDVINHLLRLHGYCVTDSCGIPFLDDVENLN
jgi:hypothetical protein